MKNKSKNLFFIFFDFLFSWLQKEIIFLHHYFIILISGHIDLKIQRLKLKKESKINNLSILDPKDFEKKRRKCYNFKFVSCSLDMKNSDKKQKKKN